MPARPLAYDAVPPALDPAVDPAVDPAPVPARGAHPAPRPIRAPLGAGLDAAPDAAPDAATRRERRAGRRGRHARPLRSGRALALALALGLSSPVLVTAAAAPAQASEDSAIDALYRSSALAQTLGAPVGAARPVGAAVVRDYQRGMIVWSATTGAHPVFGNFWLRYRAAGGPASWYGLPLTGERRVGSGVTQVFQGADMFFSATTGTAEVWGGFRDRHRRDGGAAGRYGFPTADAVPVGGGSWQTFQGADVAWHPVVGVTTVDGGFRDRFRLLGGPGGAIGFPLADAAPVAGGQAQPFHATDLLWAPTVGVRQVKGAIRDRYRSLGGPAGAMGFPLGEENPLPGGAGQGFWGGDLYWSPVTAVHAVGGAIRSHWLSRGGVTSSYHYPTSDEHGIPGGRRVLFQGGAIEWTPAGGITPPVNERAQIAVRAALSKVGAPYSYGAAGPNAFDCSGFTMWAWAHAGVALPHRSASQIDVGTRVPMSQLQPGDLVFSGNPIGHVAMYIGNGQTVAATHTGDFVRIQPLRADYWGATRVG